MNVLISIALLSTLGPSMDLPNSFKELVSDTLGSSDFRTGRVWTKGTEETSFTAYGEGRREVDRASVSIDVGRSRSTAAADEHWSTIAPSVPYTDSYAPFSELPLGTSTRRRSVGGSTWVETYDGVVSARVLVKYRGTGPRGEITWHVSDRERDKRRTEGMARKLLASASGFSAVSTSATQVAGQGIPTILGTRGERLVDLSRYCQVLGIDLTTNSEMATASFSHGGEQVVIPLAGKKIKDGTRWIESTDISLMKNSKWYVSYAALQAARGQ